MWAVVDMGQDSIVLKDEGTKQIKKLPAPSYGWNLHLGGI